MKRDIQLWLQQLQALFAEIDQRLCELWKDDRFRSWASSQSTDVIINKLFQINPGFQNRYDDLQRSMRSELSQLYRSPQPVGVFLALQHPQMPRSWDSAMPQFAKARFGKAVSLNPLALPTYDLNNPDLARDVLLFDSSPQNQLLITEALANLDQRFVISYLKKLNQLCVDIDRDFDAIKTTLLNRPATEDKLWSVVVLDWGRDRIKKRALLKFLPNLLSTRDLATSQRIKDRLAKYYEASFDAHFMPFELDLLKLLEVNPGSSFSPYLPDREDRLKLYASNSVQDVSIQDVAAVASSLTESGIAGLDGSALQKEHYDRIWGSEAALLKYLMLEGRARLGRLRALCAMPGLADPTNKLIDYFIAALKAPAGAELKGFFERLDVTEFVLSKVNSTQLATICDAMLDYETFLRYIAGQDGQQRLTALQRRCQTNEASLTQYQQLLHGVALASLGSKTLPLNLSHVVSTPLTQADEAFLQQVWESLFTVKDANFARYLGDSQPRQVIARLQDLTQLFSQSDALSADFRVKLLQFHKEAYQAHWNGESNSWSALIQEGVRQYLAKKILLPEQTVELIEANHKIEIKSNFTDATHLTKQLGASPIETLKKWWLRYEQYPGSCGAFQTALEPYFIASLQKLEGLSIDQSQNALFNDETWTWLAQQVFSSSDVSRLLKPTVQAGIDAFPGQHGKMTAPEVQLRLKVLKKRSVPCGLTKPFDESIYPLCKKAIVAALPNQPAATKAVLLDPALQSMMYQKILSTEDQAAVFADGVAALDSEAAFHAYFGEGQLGLKKIKDLLERYPGNPITERLFKFCQTAIGGVFSGEAVSPAAIPAHLKPYLPSLWRQPIINAMHDKALLQLWLQSLTKVFDSTASIEQFFNRAGGLSAKDQLFLLCDWSNVTDDFKPVFEWCNDNKKKVACLLECIISSGTLPSSPREEAFVKQAFRVLASQGDLLALMDSKTLRPNSRQYLLRHLLRDPETLQQCLSFNNGEDAKARLTRLEQICQDFGENFPERLRVHATSCLKTCFDDPKQRFLRLALLQSFSTPVIIYQVNFNRGVSLTNLTSNLTPEARIAEVIALQNLGVLTPKQFEKDLSQRVSLLEEQIGDLYYKGMTRDELRDIKQCIGELFAKQSNLDIAARIDRLDKAHTVLAQASQWNVTTFNPVLDAIQQFRTQYRSYQLIQQGLPTPLTQQELEDAFSKPNGAVDSGLLAELENRCQGDSVARERFHQQFRGAIDSRLTTLLNGSLSEAVRAQSEQFLIALWCYSVNKPELAKAFAQAVSIRTSTACNSPGLAFLSLLKLMAGSADQAKLLSDLRQQWLGRPSLLTEYLALGAENQERAARFLSETNGPTLPDFLGALVKAQGLSAITNYLITADQALPSTQEIRQWLVQRVQLELQQVAQGQASDPALRIALDRIFKPDGGFTDADRSGVRNALVTTVWRDTASLRQFSKVSADRPDVKQAYAWVAQDSALATTVSTKHEYICQEQWEAQYTQALTAVEAYAKHWNVGSDRKAENALLHDRIIAIGQMPLSATLKSALLVAAINQAAANASETDSHFFFRQGEGYQARSRFHVMLQILRDSTPSLPLATEELFSLQRKSPVSIELNMYELLTQKITDQGSSKPLAELQWQLAVINDDDSLSPLAKMLAWLALVNGLQTQIVAQDTRSNQSKYYYVFGYNPLRAVLSDLQKTLYEALPLKPEVIDDLRKKSVRDLIVITKHLKDIGKSMSGLAIAEIVSLQLDTVNLDALVAIQTRMATQKLTASETAIQSMLAETIQYYRLIPYKAVSPPPNLMPVVQTVTATDTHVGDGTRPRALSDPRHNVVNSTRIRTQSDSSDDRSLPSGAVTPIVVGSVPTAGGNGLGSQALIVRSYSETDVSCVKNLRPLIVEIAAKI